MKKFILLPIGHKALTPEIGQAWRTWFGANGKHIVDGGSPFMPGKEVSGEGVKDLPFSEASNNGYTIINAADMDEALKIAATCPYNASIRVFEAIPM